MSDLQSELAAEAVAQPDRLARLRTRVEYQGLSLAAICALVALLLLLGHRVTQPSIDAAMLEDRLAVLSQVLPAQLYDNDPLSAAFTIQDAQLGPVEIYPARKNGRLVAVAFQVSNIGYGGPILHLIALSTEGRILGVRVLSHKETPGLADKIEVSRSDWIKAFDGLSLANTPLAQWKVKKDGGQFDQFAGATITPRAVVKSVLQALQLHERHRGEFTPQEAQP